MNIWTTFCPSKIFWELTCVKTKGKSPSSGWQKNIDLIDNSLRKLKNANISGIRLVIFPEEISKDGKNFNWSAIDKMLTLCKKHHIEVDLCVGPFQYPYYPGIYFPQKLLRYVFDNKRCLDTAQNIWDYGVGFLKAQIERFGNDKRIHGFHLANEWPDMQNVFGKENIRTCISLAFMTLASEYLKENTSKPISLNTNIDVTDKNKLSKSFKDILSILGTQGKLGFDIYPSQWTYKKVPILKLKHMIFPYQRSIKSIRKLFPKTQIYFAEVEAQPWGGGQSWYEILAKELDPQEKVLIYSNDSLKNTYGKYIKSTKCKTISLWGADFWLSSEEFGLRWPLAQVKSLEQAN